jgi:ATP-dependent Clp protease ATP-binding subunit ClpA
MPSLSRSLEQALHRAIKLASDRHHEYATLEHLLLALMDDTDAGQVMKACNVDMDALRWRGRQAHHRLSACRPACGSSRAEFRTR